MALTEEGIHIGDARNDVMSHALRAGTFTWNDLFTFGVESAHIFGDLIIILCERELSPSWIIRSEKGSKV